MQITQLEKEKFIAGLSEEDFREMVVRRLFKSLGYRDGRDTCGPEEYGKDAIFTDIDRFGVENFVAVQTKVGNINLSGDPKANLHTLLAQVRTALDHPHYCTRTKKSQLAQQVFVVASGRINQAARQYIVDKSGDPRIKFLDRDDIIAKVDERCPEVWSQVIADVSPYLRLLSERVESYSLLSDGNPIHSSIGAFAAASDQRFVDVRLGFHAEKLSRRSGFVDRDFDYQEISGTSLLSGNKSVRAFLVGDAGSGKTTLLIRLAYLMAKRAVVSDKNYNVPVFVRAHEIAASIGGDVYSVLEGILLKSQGIKSSPFSIDDLDAGRFVLLVDGLDELSETMDRQNVVDFIRVFIDQYPKCSVAIASRPYSSIARLDGLDAFKRYRISPLNMQDVTNMLDGIAGSESLEWRKELLRRLDSVHGIELNPLLVTVFAVSSGSDKKDIPANITELFSKFTELMLGRWDEKKGISQQYQSKVKDHLLSLFAYELQSRGDSHFARDEFVNFSRDKLIEMNLEPDLDVMISEIIDRSGLIRGDDSELEFKHHLLQEFFAAKGIPGGSVVNDLINSEWWRNSIVFYFGSKPSAVMELLDVATTSTTIPEESYVAVGLALQACYLSKIEDRIEVWKWVVDSASKATVKFLGEDRNYPVTSFLSAYLEARDSVALGGVEKPSHGIVDWIMSPGGNVDMRRFWFATALVELGDFESVKSLISNYPFESESLATAVHFGCYFASEVRSISGDQKKTAMEICRKLDSKVAKMRAAIVEEMKGQLLEYKRSGVVALDAPDPVGV